MIIRTGEIEKQTQGNTQILNLTPDVKHWIDNNHIAEGLVTLFVPGSTGAVTTIEYEPGLLEDLPEFFEKIIPQHQTYHHDRTWHDGNGFAHLRASLLGPSLSIPIQNGKMILGTWQQIIFIDFDNRSRTRKLILQFLGTEK